MRLSTVVPSAKLYSFSSVLRNYGLAHSNSFISSARSVFAASIICMFKDGA